LLVSLLRADVNVELCPSADHGPDPTVGGRTSGAEGKRSEGVPEHPWAGIPVDMVGQACI